MTDERALGLPPPSPAVAGPRRRQGDRAVGIALVVVSAASFGTQPIIARLAYESGADPIAVLFLRFLMAAALMAGLVSARGQHWPRGRTLLALVLLGGLGYVGQSLTFFTALTMTSAGLASLLLYTFPAIVVLLSVAFLGERLIPARVAALVLALVGSALTVGAGGGGRPLGVVLVLTSAVLYSVYIVLGSRITPDVGAMRASTVILTASAVSFGLLAVAVRPAYPTGAQGWGAVATFAVATVVAVVTFFAGMSRIGPSDASTLSTLEPALTVVLAAVVLDEAVVRVQLAGGALILAAVVVLARARVPVPATAPASGR